MCVHLCVRAWCVYICVWTHSVCAQHVCGHLCVCAFVHACVCIYACVLVLTRLPGALSEPVWFAVTEELRLVDLDIKLYLPHCSRGCSPKLGGCVCEGPVLPPHTAEREVGRQLCVEEQDVRVSSLHSHHARGNQSSPGQTSVPLSDSVPSERLHTSHRHCTGDRGQCVNRGDTFTPQQPVTHHGFLWKETSVRLVLWHGR